VVAAPDTKGFAEARELLSKYGSKPPPMAPVSGAVSAVTSAGGTACRNPTWSTQAAPTQ
jgi:hypothetical protein